MSLARPALGAATVIALVLAGCVVDAEPSPTPVLTAAPTSTAAPTETPTPTEIETTAPTPTATPEPELALELPGEVDERRVTVDVVVDVPPDAGGTMLITVTSAADAMIEELVLRWPEELHETLFPAPFVPSDERIREGGEPLVQPWTKWVIGPGEHGEPAGTVSLGYGPLLAGATLEIPLFVTRAADGAVAFDLQVLAGEAILTLDDGEPAELRVAVP